MRLIPFERHILLVHPVYTGSRELPDISKSTSEALQHTTLRMTALRLRIAGWEESAGNERACDGLSHKKLNSLVLFLFQNGFVLCGHMLRFFFFPMVHSVALCLLQALR